MILLGWDIASYKTGWFAMDIENIRYKIGLLEMRGTTEERIRMLHHKAKKIINDYEPSINIIESTYLDDHRKHTNGTKKRGNLNTLKILEKCHGAVISATDDLMDITYMTPTEHKELLTGMGHAEKQITIWQIQKKLGIVGLEDNQSDAASLVFAYLIKRNQWDILEKFKNKYEK